MATDPIPSAAPALAKLIQELNKLPGIGPKSAQRLAFHIIRLPEAEAEELSRAISIVKTNITLCDQCQNLTEASPCTICANTNRNTCLLYTSPSPRDRG